MERLDAYQQCNYGWIGRIRNITRRDEVCDAVLANLQDEDFRKRHGIARWWIVNQQGVKIAGDNPPAGWSPDWPAYENDTGY